MQWWFQAFLTLHTTPYKVKPHGLFRMLEANFDHSHALVCVYVVNWLQLDQFVNGPMVYKPIIPFLNLLTHFQLYKAKWSHLETRLNSLKACQRSSNGLEANMKKNWL